MRIGARAHHSTSCTYMTVRIRLRIRWRRSSELSEICWPVFAGPAHCSVPAGRPQLLPPLPPPSRSHRGTMPTPQSLFAAARPRPPRRACRVGPGRTAPRRCAAGDLVSPSRFSAALAPHAPLACYPRLWQTLRRVFRSPKPSTPLPSSVAGTVGRWGRRPEIYHQYRN